MDIINASGGTYTMNHLYKKHLTTCQLMVKSPFGEGVIVTVPWSSIIDSMHYSARTESGGLCV